MATNNYMRNRYKLLLMVKELHKRGYENLRVVPSLSPTGLAWRCEFVIRTGEHFIASNWISELEEGRELIKHTPEELADMFSRENYIFTDKCRGENKEYSEWYSNMVNSLENGELPYAFADYFSPTDHWETSKGNKIKTLPREN
jgi:hypothetical protein